MSDRDLLTRLRTNSMGLERVAADRIEALERQNRDLVIALAECAAQLRADAMKMHMSVHGRKLSELANRADAALTAAGAT